MIITVNGEAHKLEEEDVIKIDPYEIHRVEFPEPSKVMIMAIPAIEGFPNEQ